MGYYIGVDVGSGSVRACVVDDQGAMLSMATRDISKEEKLPGHVTQSSNEIWDAVCYCVKSAIGNSNVNNGDILGIGFDATCSLVVLNKDSFEPVAAGPNFDNNNQNIIMWMDHRAIEETKEINRSGDHCLKYVGGQMSVEMEIPKIKCLKNHMAPEEFKKLVFMDLPDYLTFMASGVNTRSYCSAVCKQGFLPKGVEGSSKGWSTEFLTKIGLEEISQSNFNALGGPNESGNFTYAGNQLSTVSESFIKSTNINPGCIVGSGIIDAYAGWIGTVASSTIEVPNNREVVDMEECAGRLAAVAGTSTCHIVLSKTSIFVPGVWGPYRDVLVPDYWCAEGGQSFTGALLAHILSIHPSANELSNLVKQRNVDKFSFLNNYILELSRKNNLETPLLLTKDFFLYGDYHGNRSPIADPNMRAAIIGQSMDTSMDDLARTYLAACEFIAHQTKHIIDTLMNAGHTIKAIYMSGGQCRNNILMQLIANCTGLPLIIPKYIDSAVVFGSAILGAMAYSSSKNNSDKGGADLLWSTMSNMTPDGTTVFPATEDSIERKLINVKHKIFLDMAKTQQTYRQLVENAIR